MVNSLLILIYFLKGIIGTTETFRGAEEILEMKEENPKKY